MRRYIYILSIGAIIACTCSAAEDEDSAGQDGSIQPGVAADGAQDDLRDPFWPVDYDPEAAQLEAERGGKSLDQVAAEREKLEDSWNKAQTKLKITGLSRMAEQGYFAIINDQMVRAGDTLSVEIADGVFVWKVVDIGSEGIKLRRLHVRGYRKND